MHACMRVCERARAPTCVRVCVCVCVCVCVLSKNTASHDESDQLGLMSFVMYL